MTGNQKHGALLIAIGQQMLRNNLCADASLDGNSDYELIESMMTNGVNEEDAKNLIQMDLHLVLDANDAS